MFLIEKLVTPKFSLSSSCCHPPNEERKISLWFFPHVFLLGRRTAIVTFPSGQMDAEGKEQKAQATTCLFL